MEFWFLTVFRPESAFLVKIRFLDIFWVVFHSCWLHMDRFVGRFYRTLNFQMWRLPFVFWNFKAKYLLAPKASMKIKYTVIFWPKNKLSSGILKAYGLLFSFSAIFGVKILRFMIKFKMYQKSVKLATSEPYI